MDQTGINKWKGLGYGQNNSYIFIYYQLQYPIYKIFKKNDLLMGHHNSSSSYSCFIQTNKNKNKHHRCVLV